MTIEGIVQNGVIVLDPGGPPLAEGTRVEVAPRTGMEPLIRKTPGVCGGRACVGRRRLPVWGLVESRNLGIADETLLTDFDPPLTRAELDAAWRYAAANPEEISRDISENNEPG
ncbi:MAG: DUF433 domain-containing protein [Gemmataceae bacterium]|nr:DUF433 domain-containing protein [Gemmataceae bacterium]